ncbi:MAG: bifunctional hydroxymethylpyrimidine kinase/phosphomethylpyrimidine kinase [Proteobacteria bacterium]|nr:bifunctional hydroxymethylpyrimidine kinase/phosphomethylpyrimidine kinase [Pseudomonadota bacterium]MBU4010393.1 bifunctional hydroxymethylpyrimidine kinase/phosphomethylpyrimidine kinase [Pseudomonadota bacterium]
MKTALTIAGSDPSGGAGIQADLKTFAANGVYGTSVITAVTVQNTLKVYNVQEIKSDIVYDQIIYLFDDIHIDAVKIGMVSSIELIETIAKALKKVNSPAIVLDPVMISKSGYSLLNNDAREALVNNLFPLAEVVTPNIYEAEALAGSKISTVEDMKLAAAIILKSGAKKVVIKGGHLENKQSIDILFDGTTFKELTSTRIETKNTHGTGCTFSSAIAANLAKGMDFTKAVSNAKIYITEAIEHSLNIGHGHGPVDHFFNFPANFLC